VRVMIVGAYARRVEQAPPVYLVVPHIKTRYPFYEQYSELFYLFPDQIQVMGFFKAKHFQAAAVHDEVAGGLADDGCTFHPYIVQVAPLGSGNFYRKHGGS